MKKNGKIIGLNGSALSSQPLPNMHFLKTSPEGFDAILDGRKRYDVRLNNKKIQVGDILILVAYDPDIKQIKPGFTCLPVTYITPGGKFGIEKGYSVLGWTNSIPADQRMKDFYMFNITNHLNGKNNSK